MIQILHLSDLHFGPHSRFSGEDPARLGKAFHRALEPTLRQLEFRSKPDLMLVTGDVAETAKQKEFDSGSAFLTALAGELGLPHQRTVFVPGNHDVSWTACKRVQIDQEDEEFDDAELRRRMDLVKLERYEAFVRSFYGVEDLGEVALHLDRGALLYNFPELSLSIAALNSCEVESHLPDSHRGAISREQAQAVMDAWRVDEPGRWIKVVMVHHNPVATVRENVKLWRRYLEQKGTFSDDLIARYESDVVGFEGREHLQAIISDCRVQLVLHGHHHARDEQSLNWQSSGRAHVLSAGSLTLRSDKLPKDEPASARLIRLAPQEKSIEARSLVYVDWARTEGDVTWGAFVLDPAEREGYRQTLDLVSDFSPAASMSAADSAAPNAVNPSFLRTYRDRLRAAFSRWDLAPVGVTQTGGVGKPIEATLDDMYLPLRLANTFDIEKTDLGALINPQDLLRRTGALVIRGPGGSGKTTWMRWTFRRLLEIDRAVPIMIVLRDLARRWQSDSLTGSERSIDSFLDGWVAEHLGSGWRGEVKNLLESPSGPRPVLLVDGWDELGELGEELRRKLLGFMEQYPRLQVVVSSRPYGAGRPSGSEGFEILDIQPLSDEEILDLTWRFFARCYGKDEKAARREARHFQAALERLPDARILARTVLLLTMMLLISRSRPLPDKRHLLYEACVENLLTALPDRKQQEGAQLQGEQWRPDDSEERMRLVAALAAAIQEHGYKTKSRSAIVRTWDELAALLPPAWPGKQRMGFLAWLTGPAALLIDRADGTLAFNHLSLQEYLAAWHLNASVEGQKRIEVFRQLLEDANWWETLLLWAALIERQSRERLDTVLLALELAREGGVAVGGMMLADGLGSAEPFESWLSRLIVTIKGCWSDDIERCALAWATSRQEERKRRLLARIENEALGSRWLSWVRLREFATVASLAEELPLMQDDKLTHELVAQTSADLVIDARAVAVGRLLSGAVPVWPLEPFEIGLLHLWPGYRRRAGLRLQLALVCGARRDELPKVASTLLTHEGWNEEPREWTSKLARDLAEKWSVSLGRESAWQMARDWTRDLARGWVPDLALDWNHHWTRNWAGHWAQFWISALTRYWTQDWTRYLATHRNVELGGRMSAEIARELASRWARDWEPDDPSWVADFTAVLLQSKGHSTARAFLTNSKISADASPETRLLIEASRLSLRPESDDADFKRALGGYGANRDPLWPALARHLTRRSTETDRKLLIDLAQNPEKREPPLSWGLRFIVRGDVVFDDSSAMTLDELTEELGLPTLHFLEDLPDEIGFDAGE